MNGVLETALSNCLVAVVLAMGVACISRLRVNPNVIHVLWLMVLVKFVTPPIFTIDFSWPAADTRSAVEEVVIASEPLVLIPLHSPPAPLPAPRVRPSWNWSEWLLVAWGAGVLGIVLSTIVRVCCFHSLLRKAERAPAELEQLSADLCRRMGVRRSPEILLLPVRITPAVWSLLGRPRIVLPRQLAEEMKPEQLETILAHELAHIRRGDHLVRLLELAVTTLFWWNPVVWWARRNLREMEEHCCDGLVLEILPGSARRYAIALIETVEFLSQQSGRLPIGATAAKPTITLTRRIQMLKHGSHVRRLSGRGLISVLALALVPMTLAFAEDETPRSTELKTKVYRLGNLDAEQTEKDILERIAPEDWTKAGGPHTLKRTDNGRLIITASPEVHERIAMVLELRSLEQRRQALLKRLNADQTGDVKTLDETSVWLKMYVGGMDPNQTSGADDDATWLRRVYLDIAGILPPADIVKVFLADEEKNKRARLIQKLLDEMKSESPGKADPPKTSAKVLDLHHMGNMGICQECHAASTNHPNPAGWHQLHGFAHPYGTLGKSNEGGGTASDLDLEFQWKSIQNRISDDAGESKENKTIEAARALRILGVDFDSSAKDSEDKPAVARVRRYWLDSQGKLHSADDSNKAKTESKPRIAVIGGSLADELLLIQGAKEKPVAKKDGWLVVPVETRDALLKLWISPEEPKDQKEGKKD